MNVLGADFGVIVQTVYKGEACCSPQHRQRTHCMSCVIDMADWQVGNRLVSGCKESGSCVVLAVTRVAY